LKIALWYYIQELQDFILWISVLWKFQSVFNNIRFIATEKTSNELLYKLTLNLFLNISFEKSLETHDQLRQKIQNFINWAQKSNKAHYDKRHASLFLKIDEWALLRLHHEYFISSFKNMIKKILIQYIDSFKIIQRIKRLIYRLKISSNWKIHFVFSIVQFESTFNFAKNSYSRFKSTHSFSVTNTQNEYEIKRLLNKKTVKRDHEHFTKYLIRWKKYESEFDRWYNMKNLVNAKKLIVDYEKELKLSNNFDWFLLISY
jgi:hypothetical protein